MLSTSVDQTKSRCSFSYAVSLRLLLTCVVIVYIPIPCFVYTTCILFTFIFLHPFSSRISDPTVRRYIFSFVSFQILFSSLSLQWNAFLNSVQLEMVFSCCLVGVPILHSFCLCSSTNRLNFVFTFAKACDQRQAHTNTARILYYFGCSNPLVCLYRR